MFETSNLHFFPRGMARIGGASFDNMQLLDYSSSFKEELGQLHQVLQNLEKDKDILEAQLFDLIKEQTNTKLQNKILKFKRKITGEAIPSESLEKTCLENASDEIKKTYAGWKNTLLKSQVLREALEKNFDNELHQIRGNFQSLVQDQNLKNGLLLASNSLLNRIPSFTSKAPKDFRKKELQNEMSLYKYYSRMTSKTSPFSTFNHLIEVEMGEENSTKISAQENSASKIRLNNYLWFYLQSLFRNLPEILENYKLRLNPTLRGIDDQYEFLTNFSNVESFQKIPKDPVLELFEQILLEKQGLYPKEFVSILLEAVDADEEQMYGYIHQLVQYGFLEIDWEISGLDAFWDLKLLEKLKTCPNSKTVQVCLNGLQKTRDLCVEYEKSSLDSRRTLIDQIYDTILDTCMDLHKLAGLPEIERRMARGEKIEDKESSEEPNEEEEKDEAFEGKASTYFYFKKENVIYEDSAISSPVKFPKDELLEITKACDRFQSEMNIFEGFITERRRLKNYFLEKYSPDSKVSVLDFYEAYYRDLKLPQLEKQQEAKKAQAEGKKIEVSKDELVIELEDKRDAWLKKFKDKVRSESDCYKLSTDDLHEINEGKNHTEPEIPGSSSYGVFAQTFYENGKLKAMLNIPSGGFGKCFSRFLHLFDESFITDLKKANREFSKDELAIENCDSSFFNANLHPPLFDREIKTPGSQNGLSKDHWVSVTDLYFCLSTDQKRIELRNKKDGKIAYVYDLGFQVFDTRSQLYQLLGNFTRMRFRLFFHIQNIINAKGADEACLKGEEIWQMPRIEIDERLIIQRKTWLVPNAKFPSLDPGEDLSAWSIRIDNWRRTWNMPEQVFVSITGARELDRLPEEQRKKLSKDDYKPQYISFSSPISLRVLEKMAQKAPFSLKIEEMLPSPEQMLSFNDGKHVSELLIQWFKKESE